MEEDNYMIKILQIDKQPMTKIGELAGICYNTTNPKRYYNIGKTCVEQNHGRAMEFTNVLFSFEGYSAKMVRELFRHKMSSELQASTRYINYNKNFDYIIPPSVLKNEKAYEVWQETMVKINKSMLELEELGVPTEDYSNILPLAYSTNGVYQMNLRQLIAMCKVRLCTSAYWEYRKFMRDLLKELRRVSEEWAYIVDNFCKPKCDYDGFCSEARVKCGRYSLK